MNNQYVYGIFSLSGSSVSCLRQNWLGDAQKSKLHNDLFWDEKPTFRAAHNPVGIRISYYV